MVDQAILLVWSADNVCWFSLALMWSGESQRVFTRDGSMYSESLLVSSDEVLLDDEDALPEDLWWFCVFSEWPDDFSATYSFNIFNRQSAPATYFTLTFSYVQYNSIKLENLLCIYYNCYLPSVLCWLDSRKGIQRVKKLSGRIVAWLSDWGELQIRIWHNWWHCHSLSLPAVNSDWFHLPGWPTVLSVEPLVHCVICLSVICLSVCNILYCGKTVRHSEKLSEGVNRKPGSKKLIFGSPPYFYSRFRHYGHREGRFCLIFARTAQQLVPDGTNWLCSSKLCAYCRIVWSELKPEVVLATIIDSERCK